MNNDDTMFIDFYKTEIHVHVVATRTCNYKNSKQYDYIFERVVCESGYYGQNCINQCSINCNVFKSCDMVIGKCYFGCKPGWSGNTCDQGKHTLYQCVSSIFKSYFDTFRNSCKKRYL